MAKFETPQKALQSLELEFGNPELSGPRIIEDLENLHGATNTESESSLILKLKELYLSLTNIGEETLLTRNVLYKLCHKFRDTEGRKMLSVLQECGNSDPLRDIFFREIDSLYTHNVIWSRTAGEKGPKSRHQHVPRRQGTGNRRVAAEKVSCLLCKKEHWTSNLSLIHI